MAVDCCEGCCAASSLHSNLQLLLLRNASNPDRRATIGSYTENQGHSADEYSEQLEAMACRHGIQLRFYNASVQIHVLGYLRHMLADISELLEQEGRKG